MRTFQNGWFAKRNQPFNILDRRNVLTTKILFDFFDTTNNWNAVAQNLLWCRQNINEYQFWNLIALLQAHNKNFNNIVLPPMYEVIPTQFFTADVIETGLQNILQNDDNMENGKIVVRQNFTNGMMGSLIDDDNDNYNDLNNIENEQNNNWNGLRKIAREIQDQSRKIYRNGNDRKTSIFNNNRNLNQGNKFDNNGEDRLNYFTQDVGLNNFFYFSRITNSRVVDDKQMYNNINNKENFQSQNGLNLNRNEVNDKINRRGGRYLYQIQQLVARYNLERLSNGLDNVKQVNLDGKINNGVFTNLRYTNGIQFPNRMNYQDVKNQNTQKLVTLIKDFENRYQQAIDQGYVETLNREKISLKNNDGFNTLGDLLQGNPNNVNAQYYQNLENLYRLVLGGNYIDNVDRVDKRFVPTTMGNQETTLLDPVYWQILKRISNIGNSYKDKLTCYTRKDTEFKGVQIKNVKVDQLTTTFSYFDADITNAYNGNLINLVTQNNNNDDNEGYGNYDESDENQNNDKLSNYQQMMRGGKFLVKFANFR